MLVYGPSVLYFCNGFLPGSGSSLSQGRTKQAHRQFHLCRILTRRIPTWLWLMPSCKWPVPMHTRSPCGTSSTVNAPSQHPGRFNPPYTCKMCLQKSCACFIAPIGSSKRFFLRLSPWVASQRVPGANQAGDGQHPQLPQNAPPLP